MVRMIMNGCNGKMGQTITNLVAEDNDIEIVAGIDAFNPESKTYPVYASLSEDYYFACGLSARINHNDHSILD